MTEVYKNIFVGNQYDYESNKALFDSWAVVHACKEPYHRQALGYTGRAAPKDSPYYLFLYDCKHHLVMNIVDTDSPLYFNDELINEAINYCTNSLKAGKTVLIHCNQGESRAPSIALLLLRRLGVYDCSFEEAVIDFKKRYPFYNPKQGIYLYVQFRWNS